MNYKESLNNHIVDNDGIIFSKNVDKLSIPRIYIKQMTDNGSLIKVDRGTYITPDTWEDELYLLQHKYQKGVYSNITALYLQDLTDRTPIEYTMTFQKGYHCTTLKENNIKPFYVKKEWFDIGITECSTTFGRKVSCYNKERTICDIVRNKKNQDIQIVTGALKMYVQSNDRNIPLLSEYAKIFGIDTLIHTYLEVLL